MRTLALTLKFWLLVAFGSMVVLAAGAQNLFINPYFTDTTGWSGLNLYSGANPPPGYGNTAAIVDTSSSSLSQSIPTVPGTKYNVLWDRRLPDLDAYGVPVIGWSDPNPALLGVYANGVLIAQDLVQNRDVWAFDTSSFVATGTSTQLTFTDFTYNGIGGERSDDVFLDYAEVLATGVPEPPVSAMFLVLSGLFSARFWKAAKSTVRP